jgi:DNA-binding response OmpR family regulator
MSGNSLDRVGTKAFLKFLRAHHVRDTAPCRLLSLLASRPGRRFTLAEILDEVWGDDPSGGPLSASNGIGIRVYRLRKTGLNIVSHYGGYSYHAANENAGTKPRSVA